MYKGHVSLATFSTASGQYELLRPKVKSLKTNCGYGRNISQAPSWVIQAETEDLMASLPDNYKSSSDETSVLVSANKESKFITF